MTIIGSTIIRLVTLHNSEHSRYRSPEIHLFPPNSVQDIISKADRRRPGWKSMKRKKITVKLRFDNDCRNPYSLITESD